MTNKELHEVLKEKIKQGDCFNRQIQNILFEFKNVGGQQKTAKKIIEQLAVDFSSDETLQDRAYDILDIITGWCSREMRVWDKQKLEKLMSSWFMQPVSGFFTALKHYHFQITHITK